MDLINACGYTSSTASGPPVSLRLGHAAGLTAHRAVIQHRVAASLPQGGRLTGKGRTVLLRCPSTASRRGRGILGWAYREILRYAQDDRERCLRSASFCTAPQHAAMFSDRAVEAFSVEAACITVPWYPQVEPPDAVYWADRGPGLCALTGRAPGALW